jgi:hypothetical protein
MAQDKRNTFLMTEIGKPVPGEHALHGNDDILTEGGDGVEEGISIGVHVPVFPDLSLVIQDADIHLFRMQVDSTIIFVLFGVKLHKASSSGWYVWFLSNRLYHASEEALNSIKWIQPIAEKAGSG